MAKREVEKKPKTAPDGFRALAGPLASIAAKLKETEKGQARTPAPKKEPPKAKPSPRANEPEDEFFFARMMSGVAPIGDPRGRVSSAAPKVEPSKPKESANDPDEAVRDHLFDLVEGDKRFEVSDDGRRLEGKRLDLGDAALRRLRRGELPIDAQLDLHGKRAAEAREALEAFLRDRRTRRDRTVLVIQGRGEHSPAGVGVLRGEIAAWLSQGRASDHVAAFVTALARDGGEGALYVLLRP